MKKRGIIIFVLLLVMVFASGIFNPILAEGTAGGSMYLGWKITPNEDGTYHYKESWIVSGKIISVEYDIPETEVSP